MDKVRKYLKRLFIVLMAFVMVLQGSASTAVTVKALEEGGLNDEISTPKSYENVYLSVPESIYLKPDLESQIKTKQYAFQFYVDSSVNASSHEATPRAGEITSGTFNFYYKNAENINISYRWLNIQGFDVDGKGTSVKIFGKLVKPGEVIGVSGNTVNTFMTGGTSPAMNPETSGCFIEWTFSFKDKVDGKTKTMLAYTYVYKPNIQPVGAGVTANNFFFDDFYNSHLAWVSGIHKIGAAEPTHLGDYYPVMGGRFSLLPFASSNVTNDKQGDLYLQFPGYFDSNTDNSGASHWLTGSSNYFKIKSFRKLEKNFNMESWQLDLIGVAGVMSPSSSITVDISRYTNLDQVPNLSCGMMVTDDEYSQDGAVLKFANRMKEITEEFDYTYYNDYTRENLHPNWFVKENYGDVRGEDIMPPAGYEYDDDIYFGDSSSEDDGLKYLGKWHYKIKSTEKNKTGWQYIYSLYWNRDDGDYAVGRINIPVQITTNDKAALRNAVTNAQKHMAQFGMNEVEKSYFYDSYSMAWVRFNLLYKEAQKMLSALDYTPSVIIDGKSYSSCDAVAGLLNDAVAALEKAGRVHFINTEAGAHGSLSVSSNEEFAGKNVHIYPKTDAGYELDKIEIKDASGKDIEAMNAYAGEYIFVMPESDVMITATFKVKHVHMDCLTKVESQEPTCTEEGNKAYYQCTCGRWYEDYKAEREITDHLSVVISALGHIEEVDKGQAPTCTQTGLTAGVHCQRCLEVLTAQKEIAALGHSIDEEAWVSDEESHWHFCSSCGQIEDAGKHQLDNAKKTCSVCGYKKEAEHEHTPSVEVPGKGSCQEVGNVLYYICECGQWLYPNGEKITDYNDVLVKLNHVFVEIEGKAATCTEAGLTEGIGCETCGGIFVKQEEIPALGHHEIKDEAVAPTCSESGLTEGSHCGRCGEIIKAQEEIAALGHEEVIIEAAEASCSEEGHTEGRYCSRCNEVFKEVEVIPALGHEEVTRGGGTATCEETEMAAGVYCCRCDIAIKLPQALQAIGHELYVEAGKEATCIQEGLTDAIYCQRCDKTLSEHEVIPLKGHIDEDNDGYCEVCKAKLGYLILEGREGKWEKGSKKEYRIKAESKIIGLSIDKEEVGAENYRTEEGKTVIMIRAEYLEKMMVGKHILKVQFEEGFAEAEFEVIKSTAEEKPTSNTGDMAPVTVLTTMMLASAACYLELKRRAQ